MKVLPINLFPLKDTWRWEKNKQTNSVIKHCEKESSQPRRSSSVVLYSMNLLLCLCSLHNTKKPQIWHFFFFPLIVAVYKNRRLNYIFTLLFLLGVGTHTNCYKKKIIFIPDYLQDHFEMPYLWLQALFLTYLLPPAGYRSKPSWNTTKERITN